jgi:hypothetical protein
MSELVVFTVKDSFSPGTDHAVQSTAQRKTGFIHMRQGNVFMKLFHFKHLIIESWRGRHKERTIELRIFTSHCSMQSASKLAGATAAAMAAGEWQDGESERKKSLRARARRLSEVAAQAPQLAYQAAFLA